MELAVLRRWLRASMCTIAIVAGGCFTDVPSDGTTMIGQTEGEVCPAGTASCPCYGNDTCDTGLSCAEGANVCVPTGCDPGSHGCVCDEGNACDDGLECEGSVCMLPNMSTGMSTDPSESSDPSTTGDTEPDDDDSSTTIVSTTIEPMTESASSLSTTDPSTSTTTGLDVCGDLGCGACTDCVTEPGQSCGELWEMCEEELGCATIAACMQNCGVNGLCSNCCSGHTPSAIDIASNLNVCRADHCISTCGEYPSATCNP